MLPLCRLAQTNFPDEESGIDMPPAHSDCSGCSPLVAKGHYLM